MRCSRLACCLLLVVPVLSAQAEVYRYVDKHGNHVFTDSPPEGAEKVPPKPVMTMPFPKVSPITNGRVEVKKPAIAEYKITLLSPPADMVYRRGEGAVPVAVSVSPSLREGHSLEVRLDGKPVKDSAIPLDESLDRGTHTLTAQIVDAKGNVVAAAQSVSFHVQQPSALSPSLD